MSSMTTQNALLPYKADSETVESRCAQEEEVLRNMEDVQEEVAVVEAPAPRSFAESSNGWFKRMFGT